MDASQASARLAAGMPAMLLCGCANQYRISSKSDKGFLGRRSRFKLAVLS
jgi:hypothetical protein